MKPYLITSKEAGFVRRRVEASNVHTAIKKMLYVSLSGERPRTWGIVKGQQVTITVERIL